jgi:hypothetical protein
VDGREAAAFRTILGVAALVLGTAHFIAQRRGEDETTFLR